MSDDDLVTVYTTEYPDEISLVKLRLDQADIPHLAQNESIAFWYRVGKLAEVRFLVQRRDAQRARQVLQETGLTNRPRAVGPIVSRKAAIIVIIAAAITLLLIALLAAD